MACFPGPDSRWQPLTFNLQTETPGKVRVEVAQTGDSDLPGKVEEEVTQTGDSDLPGKVKEEVIHTGDSELPSVWHQAKSKRK